MNLTKDQFHRILPLATAERIEEFYPRAVSAMEGAAIVTPLRIAHFLAQVGHECCDLLYLEEIADGSAYEGRRDLGNVFPGDGKRFKGRGLIQLTGRENYECYGYFANEDFISHPEQISLSPLHAVSVATWFWTNHQLNSLADKDDAIGITKRVNGATRGLPDRQARLERAKKILFSEPTPTINA